MTDVSKTFIAIDAEPMGPALISVGDIVAVVTTAEGSEIFLRAQTSVRTPLTIATITERITAAGATVHGSDA